MNLSSISIQRPVLASVFSIITVLFGVIGFQYLGVRDYPSVDPPVITVSSFYPGANSEVMLSQVTEPLEESINGIDGIKTITSNSSEGRSTIVVEFYLGVDLEAAANDVRDRVARAQRNLPPDIDPPRVIKSDADARPIISLTVSSRTRDLLSLSELGNILFKERFETIPGVSEVRIWGEKKYAMRLMMNPAAMAALEISPQDVRNALQRQNVELPTGRIEGEYTEMSIRTLGRLETESDFNKLIIREERGQIVRFSDIGHARLSPENERSLLRGNGAEPMIGIAITPQPGANYISIADEFHKRLEVIKREMPEDISLGMALDSTVYIRKSIKEVKETVLIAFTLVLLVIFFFLRNWRSTLIPVITIPISLISTFFIMYLAGFSINVLSLLGVVLATGLVVDDAIVMLENIYQKIERGMSPREAAFKGSKEIVFAIISTTITLISVFLPVIFLEGLTGRLFREFGVVVAGAVIVSSFVSLTLTPMMCSRLLKSEQKTGWLHSKTEAFFVGMNAIYIRYLNAFMRRRYLSLIIMAGSVAIIFLLGRTLNSELAPLEDKGRIALFATAPEGTSYNYMADLVENLILEVDTIPEKEYILSVTAPGFGASSAVNTGFVRISLVDHGRRKRSQMEIAEELTQRYRNNTSARIIVTQEQTIGDRRGGLPVQFVLQTNDFEKLRDVLPVFLERAGQNPAFSAVDANLKFNKPELEIEIDRSRAEALGVSIFDIAQTLQLYFSEQRMGFFIKNGRQYQVLGQALPDMRGSPSDLKTVFVRNNKNKLIQLDNLIRIAENSNPPQIYRYNRFVSATVSAGMSPGVTLGQGIDEMRKIADEVLDDSFSTDLAGPSKDFAESSSTLVFAFVLALILVFLTLSAQFESFIDPLIIMLAVPLALAGAVIALVMTGSTLNIFSQIGIIVLTGIVTKNGILIVEFANQYKRAGKDTLRAVLDASASRFRPIVMTSLATSLGALPIALALGSASTSRVSMGIAIIGGLLFSLILTLFVIPALYTYMSRAKTIYNDEEIM